MKRIYSNLLILGIALGIVSALLVLGAGQSMIQQQSVINKIKKNNISFYKVCMPSESQHSYRLTGISLSNAEEIKKLLHEKVHVSILSPAIQLHDAIIRSREEILNVDLILTDDNFDKIGIIDIRTGRFISAEDYLYKQKVCVINSNLYNYLGVGNSSININNITYEVIGVFSSPASSEGVNRMFDINYDKAVFIPATTAYTYIYNTNEESAMIYMLPVKVSGEEEANEIQDLLQSTAGQEKDLSRFKVMSGLEVGESLFLEQLKMFTVFFISSLLILIIAALNIIQISAANVIDRSRQIGLQLALGARPWDITREVTGEILICTLKGGYIGIAISGVINTQINYHLGFYLASFNIFTVIQGLALTLLTGLITALIPARNAARLNPIQALRQE